MVSKHGEKFLPHTFFQEWSKPKRQFEPPTLKYVGCSTILETQKYQKLSEVNFQRYKIFFLKIFSGWPTRVVLREVKKNFFLQNQLKQYNIYTKWSAILAFYCFDNILCIIKYIHMQISTNRRFPMLKIWKLACSGKLHRAL